QEIERLKALLAEREAQERASAQAAAAAPALETASDSAAAAQPASAADAHGQQRLASQGDVLQALQALEQRVALADSRRSARGASEILHVKRMQNGREVEKFRVTLQALGGGQYRGNEALPPGDYEMVLGLQRWPVKLANGEGGD